MDSASESTVESDGILRTSTRRMTVLIVSMTVLVVAIFVASMLLFVDLGNTPLEVREELTQLEYPSYDMEERRVLEEANDQLARMELGNIQQVDPDSSNYKARLYRDNNWGILFWEFKDSDTEIWVDSETGEIFQYFSLANMEEGPRISDEDIPAYVEELMSQFAPIPPDLESPSVYHSSWMLYRVLLPNGTSGDEEMFMDWIFVYNRTIDGILTTDGFYVDFEVDGTLIWYEKEMFMDLDGIDTTYAVTAEEAEEVAREYLATEHGEPEETLIYCRKEICWPMDMDGGLIPGTTPICVWQFEFDGPGPSCNTHWVAVTGEGNAEVVYFDHCD